jgi:drug/metabolite transporter (DMT)-like permease
MLVLCTGLWAVSFPTMKALTMTQQGLVPAAGSWFFTSLDVMCRFGVAGLIMLVLSLRTLRQVSRREIEQGLGLALFGAGGILFQMDGLAHTAASTSAFLTQCYALLIPIWVALRHRRWPSRRVFACCGLVLAGVAVLSRLNWQDLKLGRGELETIVASILFTGQILWLERPVYATNNVSHFSWVMFIAMAAFSAPLALATAPQAADAWRAWQSGPALGFLGILVVFSTLGGYILMNHWQRHLAATEAGLIYCFEPVLASTLALFLPGWFSRWAGIDYPDETLTAHLLLGGGLITLANILLQVANRWPKAEAPQPAALAAASVPVSPALLQPCSPSRAGHSPLDAPRPGR